MGVDQPFTDVCTNMQLQWVSCTCLITEKCMVLSVGEKKSWIILRFLSFVSNFLFFNFICCPSHSCIHFLILFLYHQLLYFLSQMNNVQISVIFLVGMVIGYHSSAAWSADCVKKCNEDFSACFSSCAAPDACVSCSMQSEECRNACNRKRDIELDYWENLRKTYGQQKWIKLEQLL